MNHAVETFTGIRPTADLTVANYIGAIQPLLEQEKEGHRSSVFLAELHAATTARPAEVLEHSKQLTRTLIASGVEGEIYRQYDIRDLVSQTELALRGLTTISRLLRLPTLKEKVTKSDDVQTATVNLAMYPMMMASDIILARPEYVPTGKDQKPHLELTNELIRSFNREYDADLPEPTPRDEAPVNIMSLDGSGRKMSKTLPAGAIFLNSSEDEARRKIMKAPTAGGPGEEMNERIDNLLTITRGISTNEAQTSEIEALGERVKQGERLTKELKMNIADVVVKFLVDFDDRRASVSDADMKNRTDAGHDWIRPIASDTLAYIEKKQWS